MCFLGTATYVLFTLLRSLPLGFHRQRFSEGRPAPLLWRLDARVFGAGYLGQQPGYAHIAGTSLVDQRRGDLRAPLTHLYVDGATELLSAIDRFRLGTTLLRRRPVARSHCTSWRIFEALLLCSLTARFAGGFTARLFLFSKFLL